MQEWIGNGGLPPRKYLCMPAKLADLAAFLRALGLKPSCGDVDVASVTDDCGALASCAAPVGLSTSSGDLP